MVSITNLELLMADLVMDMVFILGEIDTMIPDRMHALDPRVQLVLKLFFDDVELSDFLVSAGVVNHTIDVEFSQSLQSRFDGAGHLRVEVFEFFLALMGGLNSGIMISLVATTAFATAAPTATTRFAAASFGDGRSGGSDSGSGGGGFPGRASFPFGRTGSRGIGKLGVVIHHVLAAHMWVRAADGVRLQISRARIRSSLMHVDGGKSN